MSGVPSPAARLSNRDGDLETRLDCLLRDLYDDFRVVRGLLLFLLLFEWCGDDSLGFYVSIKKKLNFFFLLFGRYFIFEF